MKFTNIPDLGPYFTFTPSKSKPIYNWLYYKEAFSPECIEFFLNKFQIKEGTVVDPFCGIGTTLLYSKSKNLNSYGTDASPLAVFTSKVKCENYSEEDIREIRNELKQFPEKIQKINSELKWKTELFSPEKVIPKSSLNFILKTRELISQMKNEKIHNLFLLSLLSIIPQISLLIKDGGVLKYDKRKRAIPAKIAFKRKIKKILSDLEKNNIQGPVPKIEIGDARKINIQDSSVDAVITSPPYLNNIDYTKIYGLELSLLFLDPDSANTIKQTRKDSIASFHSADERRESIPKEAEEFGIKYPLIGAYFSDMEQVLKESYRILKPNSSAVFIVGNSIMHDLYIMVDEILGEIGQRLNFESEILTSLKRTASTQKTKLETRESAVILRKK